jgi:alkylated DNA nucleotide flippase Atl1
MARRETKYIRDLKKQIAKDRAKRVREAKKKSFEEVMVKGSVETYGDLSGIFNGLSRAAKDLAAYHRIAELARFRKTPREIIEIMEPKRRPKEENTND